MVFFVTVLALAAFNLPAPFALSLRRFGMEEVETERSLLSPRAHTGFVSVLDDTGDQRLVVRCEQGQREQVRAVLEHIEHPTLPGHHSPAGHVQFCDEPV